MSLNHREQHQLHRIETRLLRSDPHLDATMAVFARLSAGQRMPTWEQIASRLDRVRQAAALIAKAIAVLAASICLLGSAFFALLAAVVMGGRARPPQAAGQQTSPGTDDHADPASWA